MRERRNERGRLSDAALDLLFVFCSSPPCMRMGIGPATDHDTPPPADGVLRTTIGPRREGAATEIRDASKWRRVECPKHGSGARRAYAGAGTEFTRISRLVAVGDQGVGCDAKYED